jgi:hypothetical protein
MSIGLRFYHMQAADLVQPVNLFNHHEPCNGEQCVLYNSASHGFAF